MVLNKFFAVVVFEIISNLVSMQNSLAYNCWHKKNIENCPTLLIVGIPSPGFYKGVWGAGGECRFLKILSNGVIGTNSNWLGLRGYHGNLETFFNLSSTVVVLKPFVGAFLFVFLDDIALNQQTSFFLNFSFLFILFTFQLK